MFDEPFSVNKKFAEVYILRIWPRVRGQNRGNMPTDTIVKTIHQYSSMPISAEDMQKLLEIAKDYAKVKNYVYQRFGGIGSLSKLYPGYTVQNEMTQSGLKAELGLPSVYFYLAVFDALGDIKTQWSKTKTAVLKQINKNEEFTQEEKHYLRFALKVDGCLANILCGKRVEVPPMMEEKYKEFLSGDIRIEKLNSYLCRQIRKKLKKMHTDKAEGFSIAERAYRYGSNGNGRDRTYGIFISTKEKRKRIYIPLTDTNTYKKQLYVKLDVKNNTIQIAIPKEKKIKHYEEYTNEIGISIGMWQMITTHEGHIYGEMFGEKQNELAEFIANSSKTFHKEKENNTGRKKYFAKKARLEAALHDYINYELNRFIAVEHPQIIYLPKLPKPSVSGVNKKINYSSALWQRGYIRKRFEQKCKENSVDIVEVIGKGISTECSRCGEQGNYYRDSFKCSICGYEEDKKCNAAQNALIRGKTGRRLNTVFVDAADI